MKYFNKILASIIVAATGVTLTGCFGDLDTMPLDDNQIVSEQVYTTTDGYMGMLAKCYASLILSGQQGGDGGDPDVQNADGGYQSYIRLMFYLEELCTDNFLMPSTSNGLRQCLNQQWTSNNASVVTWTWQRLYTAIAYCNEFLRECTEEKLNERGLWGELGKDCYTYRAEVRMIRAYCYEVLCDLYGNVPLIDESTGVKDIPQQISRKEIFNFAVSELKAISGEGDSLDELSNPGATTYAHVDKVAAWFLLARMYLNSETWIGENNYNNALTYAKKVIDCNVYPLASDYRHIFLADNNTCSEIIWPLVADGINSQGSGGTNFYVKAFVNGAMNDYYNTGVGTRGWGNVRSKTTLWSKFDAADVPFDINDTWGNNKMDKRAQFMTALPGQVGETWDTNLAMTSTYSFGYGYIKWRNVTKNDQICASGEAFTSIDFPLFRTADAYLMAAEAILRGASGGSQADALNYVNTIRARAYMSDEFAVAGIRSDVSGKIAQSELTLDFILAERSRELASEIIRRTDLIRFGKFSKGNNWDWKDGERLGRDISDHLQLFPIPESEMTNNPTLVQNPGYASGTAL